MKALAIETLKIAASQVGVKEASGNNDGAQVGVYQRFVEGHSSKEPWCADFVSWCVYQAAASLKIVCRIYKTASAPALYQQGVRLKITLAKPVPGCIGFVKGHGGISHTFFVVDVKGNEVLTIDGNYGDKVARTSHLTSQCVFMEIA